MINNFDDFEGDMPDDDREAIRSLEKALQNGLSQAINEQLPPAEREFIETKVHAGARAILKDMTPKELASWFFKEQEAGRIPSDWPATNCKENPGRAMIASDWPTFVLFTAITHSGPDLDILPDSYEDVRNFIWVTKTGVVLVWDGQNQMARLATGPDKEHAIELKRLCDNKQLGIEHAIGNMPAIATAFRAFFNAVGDLSPSLRANALKLACESSGMLPEQMKTAIALNHDIWARLMVRQMHGFHLHRCVVIGAAIEVAEGEEEFTPEVNFRVVLCHYDECGGEDSHATAAMKSCENGNHKFVTDLVIDDADAAFAVYDNLAEWSRIDVDEWVLTPKALECLENYKQMEVVDV